MRDGRVPANINPARSALADPDPMVRIGALEMLANVSAAQIWPLAASRFQSRRAYPRRGAVCRGSDRKPAA